MTTVEIAALKCPRQESNDNFPLQLVKVLQQQHLDADTNLQTHPPLGNKKKGGMGCRLRVRRRHDAGMPISVMTTDFTATAHRNVVFNILLSLLIYHAI